MKGILIIGATSAIAAACARVWAEQGCRLYLVGRDPGKLQAIAADLTVRGARAVGTFVMDAQHTHLHGEMIDAARAVLGRVDVALIAHGTLPDQRACEQDPSLALHELGTNGTSVIALLLALAPVMEQQGAGALGVITSVAGDRGRPSNFVYGSAKAAVSACCEGLRARLFRSGVSVTDIRPGFVATPMTQALNLPRRLVAQPETVALRIVGGIEREANVLYVPGFWWLIMLIIRTIPRAVFKRLKL